MKSNLMLLFLLLGIIPFSMGQELLQLEAAINEALENNYGILVAKNDARINANNAHPGAAGLFPTISGTGGANYNRNDTKVEFAAPTFDPVDVKGAVSTSLNAGVNLNYTVFDGMGNVNTFRVLKRTAELSETQTQAIIESTISQIGNAYYSIARLAESYKTLSQSIEISKDRLKRARTQQEFGGTNKLAVLNAEVDLNTDSANLAVTFFNLENAKRNLNALIGRPVNETFNVISEVAFSQNMQLQNLIELAKTNNVNMRIADYNQQIAELNLKIAKSSYMPVIGVTAGYNYNQAANGPGSILKTQENLGLTAGASLNIPIFSGNQRKVSVQNAQLNILNSQYRQEETMLNLERDLSNAFFTYQSTLHQLDLEQKSLESAGENFTRTQDAFKLGQATNIQFRDAQLNLQRVKDRINDLRYTAKLNEIEVLRLSGQLIK